MPAHFSRSYTKGTYRKKSGNRIARRANRTKKYAKRSKGAKAQSRQIVDLSKSVSALAKRLPGENYNLSQGLYHRLHDVELGGVANTSCQIIPLLPCLTSNVAGTIPAWRPWGPGLTGAAFADANDQLPTFTQAARQGTLDLQMNFDIGDENDSSINFTVCVCTLHKDVAAQLTDSNLFGYDLQGMTNITQTSGDRYFCRGAAGSGSSYPSTAGFVTLAPDKFKVLKKTQFNLAMMTPQYNTLQEGRTLVTNRGDTRKFIHWKIPMNYTIGPERNDAWSEIRPSPQLVPPHNVRYLMIFTDNQTADAESPYMNMFCSTIVKGLV